MAIDIVVFGPHPDDAELGCGGLLLKMKDLGYKTAIVHLTAGEMGTGGSSEVRLQELENAAKALNLDHIEVMDFHDCQIVDDFESRLKIATIVRQLRPKIVLAPYWGSPPGRGLGHTDHIAAGNLVSHGVNFAHLHKMPIPGEIYAVPRMFYYLLPQELVPTFIVDISAYAEQWFEALKCHKSQFYNEKTKSFDFIEAVAARAQSLGRIRGMKYAQGFYSPVPLLGDDPFVFVEREPGEAKTEKPSHERWP